MARREFEDLLFVFLCVQNGSSASLELDLEHYVVPAPPSSGPVYAANNTETPRSLSLTGVFTKSDGSSHSSVTYRDSGIPIDRSSRKVYLITSSLFW